MNSLDANRPHLIITVGVPGSGKSFFAKNFSKSFKSPIISSQQIGALISENIPSIKPNDLNKLAIYLLKEALKTERTVVFDGETCTQTARAELVRIAKSAGYEPLFVWVQTDQSTAKKRSIDKQLRTKEQFEAAIKRFNPPRLNEKPIVVSGKHTYATQLKVILKHLARSDAKNDAVRSLNRTLPKINYLIR